MHDRLEHGVCFCGAITAELRGEPFWICFDHDDDCRRATGGAVPQSIRLYRRQAPCHIV